MKAVVLGLLGAAVALGLLAAAVGRGGRHRPAAQPNAGHERAVDRPRHQRPAFSSPPWRPAEPAGGPIRGAPPAEEVPESAADDPPRPPSPEQALHALDSMLAGEGRDAKWAADNERAIAVAVAGPELAGSHLVSAACARTLCRVEIQHDSVEAEDRFRARAPFLGPFATDGASRRIGSEEAPRTLAFVARAGFPLPGGG